MFSPTKICVGLLAFLMGPTALALDVPPPGAWFPVGEFGAPRVTGGVQEKIMGGADFIRVASLNASDPDVLLSRKIGFLLFEMVENGKKVSSSCSGSLVGPDLFLTNHHCIANGAGAIQDASRYFVVMEYLVAGSDPPASSFSNVAQFVVWDASLDFALLKLGKPLGKSYGWLEIETDENSITRHRDVKIIQHPAGRPKEIVRSNTMVVNSNGPYLHYLADTEGGSSGSPVFAGKGDRVIALHHVGTTSYNEGVKMSAIVPMLRPYLPVTGSATPTRALAPAPTQPAAAPAQPAPAPTQPRGAPNQPAPKQPQPATPAPGTWTPVTGD